MKTLSAFIVIPFCLLQIQPACADCAEIDRQASARRSAFIVAKDDYKRETTLILRKPFSEETIAMGIASGRRMKRAIDELVAILNRSMVEGCFRGDSTVWRDVITKIKAESDAIDKTIQTFLEWQDADAKRPN